MTQIWRKKSEPGAFFGKTEESRKKQLANLKGHNKGQEQISGNLSKFNGAEGFKLFVITHCRNLEGKIPIILPWYEEVIEAIFNEEEGEDSKVDLVLASTQKKSGKSFLGSCLAIYWALFVDSPCEIVCASNSKEQSREIILSYCRKVVSKNPALRRLFRVRENDITCVPTESVIRAVASLNAPAIAGKSISLLIFDESGLFDRESQERLRDELKLSPVKTHAVEIHISTIGWLENEFSRLLKIGLEEQEKAEKGLEYDKSMKLILKQGPEILAPWISEKFLERQRRHTKSQIYYRLWENTFTADTEKLYVTPEQIKACTSGVRGVRRKASVVIAIDASVSGDSTSLVCVEHREDSGIYTLIDHAITTPTKETPIDYQQAVIDKIYEWVDDFGYSVLKIVADPYQLLFILQGLRSQGFSCQEFTQSINNLTSMSHYLYTLIESRKFSTYDNPEIREHFANCSTKLVSGGSGERYRIVKASPKRHIDLIVCVCMACLTIARGIEEEGSDEIDVLVGGFENYPGGQRGGAKPAAFISDIFGIYDK